MLYPTALLADALADRLVTGVAARLGYANPADLVEKYPKFYWERIEPYIGEALRCLRRTMAGKEWIAHL